MNRRELLRNASCALVTVALPIPAFAAKPIYLYHYEVMQGVPGAAYLGFGEHVSFNDREKWLGDFDREIIRSDLPNHRRAQLIVQFARDSGIKLSVSYEIEPSDYFAEYRKLVYYGSAVNEADHARLLTAGELLDNAGLSRTIARKRKVRGDGGNQREVT